MKYEFVILVIAACCLLPSCAQPPADDQRFESLAGNYIEKLLQTNPELATGLGDHRFDSRLDDYTIAGVDLQRSLCKAYLDSLSQIDEARLNPANKIDLKILRTNLQSTIELLTPSVNMNGILSSTMSAGQFTDFSRETSHH